MQSSLKTKHSPLVSEVRSSDPVFDLAPISLWLEDYSLVKNLLDSWKFTDAAALQQFFDADKSRISACAQLIKIIKVNQKTLDIYGAKTEAELVSSIGLVFRDDMLDNLASELVQLWSGKNGFSSHGVNYTLSGERLDILLNARLMPGFENDWGRVLISVDDITRLEDARRKQTKAEQYANGLFEHSPISLWVQDLSQIKLLFAELRAAGIHDFRTFTDVNPEFVQRCASEIRILDVNNHSLKLYCAPTKDKLLSGLDAIFRDSTHESFREQLIELWNGKLFQQREVINYALDGTELYLHLQFSVLPGYEHDWSLAQYALTDITARKKAETYLEFLGKNDVLTKLYNRTFFTDEMARLQRKGPFPVTAIIMDINGLKEVNDSLGHSAGDELLRRAGEVLQKAVEKPCIAARIGGDEFVVLMPSRSAEDGETMIRDINTLIGLNNEFYKGKPLSFSMGAATGYAADRLDDVIKQADEAMYVAKRQFKALTKSQG